MTVFNQSGVECDHHHHHQQEADDITSLMDQRAGSATISRNQSGDPTAVIRISHSIDLINVFVSVMITAGDQWRSRSPRESGSRKSSWPRRCQEEEDFWDHTGSEWSVHDESADLGEYYQIEYQDSIYTYPKSEGEDFPLNIIGLSCRPDGSMIDQD